MDKRTRDFVVGTLAVGAAAVAIYFALAGGSQKINLGPYDVLGAVTAEETAKLLGNKGQVLVMARGTGVNINPSVEAELKAFQQTLRNQSGMSVIIDKVQVSPNQMMATGGAVPSDMFLKAIETHPNLGALVLFMGFPQLNDAELEGLKKSGVKIVVACTIRPNDRQLIERQVIHLALVPRSDSPPPGAPTPRTVRERFDQEFTIVTSATTARSP